MTPSFEERDAQRRLDPRGARLEFDRSRRDFSERDRVLDILLPHLKQFPAPRGGSARIEIARAYPTVRVDGIDSDHASIERAREDLVGSGLEDRVTFQERDAADAELAGRYDLVTIFEALHDMSYPVDVLLAARRLLVDGGALFIGDERTEDAFTAPASEVERLFYGFSVFHCLPVGTVGKGAAGTGTVIRADTVRRYATEAGFSSCEVLPIENDFWRFYLLKP